MNELLIEILGGLAVGASLGLVGAGGAILSVPIFEVLLGHDPKEAIAEALLVTCAVAAVSAARAAAARTVDWPRVLLLGVPGMAGAAIGGWFAHTIPDMVQMTMFGIVALIAAWKMAQSPRTDHEPTGVATAGMQVGSGAQPSARADAQPSARADAQPSARVQARPRAAPFALAEAGAVGLGIGVLTGVIGVGGGFLLVPALVLLLRAPMRVAVGTSLAVITMNSAIGFIGNRMGDANEVHPDWQAVAVVAAFGIAGSLIGSSVAGRLPAPVLRKVFAAILVCVAVLVIARQFVGKAS